MRKKRIPVILILEDRKYFEGALIGDLPEDGKIGEVVFNTSMSGYQEIISDPSYKGQMVCFTYPSIGNYGFSPEDEESEKPFLEAIILRDYCERPSNYRAEGTLEDYLKKNKIPAISQIDTRALVRHIREAGSMMGGLFLHPGENLETFVEEKTKLVQGNGTMEGKNLANGFSYEHANAHVKTLLKKYKLDSSKLPKVAVLDFGIKYSILENFIKNKLYPIVFPGDTAKAEWKNFNENDYTGYFFSNGPGDPAVVTTGVENIKSLAASKKPCFGICLGHQMLSLALGAKTFKMKFGHHGGNQPVTSSNSSRVIITAQNHGFAVEEDSLKQVLGDDKNITIESNPNDKSIEGFAINNENYNVLSVQFHPEASPGPNDAHLYFREFADTLTK